MPKSVRSAEYSVRLEAGLAERARQIVAGDRPELPALTGLTFDEEAGSGVERL